MMFSGTIFGIPARTAASRLVLVLAGGAIGSGARYLTGLWTADRFGATFPWGTLAVNVLGCFLIGLLATLADEAGAIGPAARTLLVVGVLGGFTTFSSFSLDTWRLVEQGETIRGGAYLIASLGVAFVALVLGIGLARALQR